MIANIDTVLVGKNIVLVPYRSEHVHKYHEWMLDDELRSLTASEPLSLEEEYEMQKKWQSDDDKLTFIILSSLDDLMMIKPLPASLSSELRVLLPGDPQLARLEMIGDVNIFLHGAPDGGDLEAEVEIMIAETLFRRKGLAFEALQLMLTYATGQPQAFYSTSLPPPSLPDSPLNLALTTLVARIGSNNTASINLFEKLGFKITKYVEIFDQVEMRYYK